MVAEGPIRQRSERKKWEGNKHRKGLLEDGGYSTCERGSQSVGAAGHIHWRGGGVNMKRLDSVVSVGDRHNWIY